jgi:hypothetical protein
LHPVLTLDFPGTVGGGSSRADVCSGLLEVCMAGAELIPGVVPLFGEDLRLPVQLGELL